MISGQAQEFVEQHCLGVLGTVDPHGEPWGSAVFYANDEDGNVYFLTRDGTRKYQNLAANPRVSFVIFDESHRQTLQMTGLARPVSDPAAIADWSAKIRGAISQADPDLPVDHMENGDYHLIKLEFAHSYYSDYKS